MSEQTYSINGLSDLLGKDRRTLKKLLRGIPAVEERSLGAGRLEKRWHLADATSAIAMDEIGIDPAQAWSGCRDMLKTFVATELFPKLTSNPAFFSALTGYARKDLRMTKAEALDFVSHITFCLMSATSAVFDDETMKFRIDGVLSDWPKAKLSGTTEEFLRGRWPDEASA